MPERPASFPRWRDDEASDPSSATISICSSISVTPTHNFILWPAHLQRPESDFVKHRWIEKLYVGILEDQRHSAPEAEFDLRSLQPIFGQRLAAE